MLTLQHLSRQLRGCTAAEITLLPGCMSRLVGDIPLARKLLKLIAGRKSCPKNSILFAEQETRGDAEFFTDIFYLSRYQKPHFLMKRRSVEVQLQHWAKEGAPQLLDAAIHFFQLSEVLKTPLGKLDDAWWQRVRLAQLILNPCTIWLLEEPLARLDDEGRHIMEVLMAGRCKQSGIVIFTHQGETNLNPHAVLTLASNL
jgi:ABC-type transport system involved in cytochrome c biogenesis ATPase subunit